MMHCRKLLLKHIQTESRLCIHMILWEGYPNLLHPEPMEVFSRRTNILTVKVQGGRGKMHLGAHSPVPNGTLIFGHNP